VAMAPRDPADLFYCFCFNFPLIAGSGLAACPSQGRGREPTRQSGHRTQVVPFFFFFPGQGEGREGTGGLRPSHRHPFPETQGQAPLDGACCVLGAWRRGAAAPTRGAPASPSPPRSRTMERVSEGSGSLAFFFFSLFLYFTYTLAIQWRSRRESGKDGITEAQ
jgi:hypothetical protein